MTKLFSRFAKDESGATAIEYGLIAGLLSVTIIGVLGIAGENLQGVFSTVGTELGNATP
jgi:pilus assembly protein Flp/PilA